MEPAGPARGDSFTIVILLSEIPNTMIKKAAEAYDVAAIRRLFPVLVGDRLRPAGHPRGSNSIAAT